MDYFDKMRQVFTLMGDEGPVVDRLHKAKSIFKEIHDYVQDVALFTGASDKYNEYAEQMKQDYPDLAIRIKNAWNFFLIKVCDAPTDIHIIGCVILQIPYIYTLMVELEQDQVINKS